MKRVIELHFGLFTGEPNDSKKKKLTTTAAEALKLGSFDFGQLGPITYSSFITNGLDQLEWGPARLDWAWPT